MLWHYSYSTKPNTGLIHLFHALLADPFITVENVVTAGDG